MSHDRDEIPGPITALSPSGSSRTRTDERIERVALERRILTRQELSSCRAIQASARQEGRPAPPLAQVLLQEGLVDAAQLVVLLRGAHGKADHPTPQAGVTPGPGPVPSSRLGRYELVREIAQGGMGTVYEAVDPQLGRLVALKVLKTLGSQIKALERFQREARLAASLSHPNLITIYEVGSETSGNGTIHFLTMDFVEGPTLDNALPELDLEARLRIMEQVTDAIGYAHDRGVVHRDLKPSNILLTPNGTPVVTDFGLAVGDSDVRLTRSDAVIGTTLYMAPEQVLGYVDKIDPRTDVWALGVILYQLLTNVMPFEGETSPQVHDRILRDDPTPLRRRVPDVSWELEAICLKALEKDPRRRYSGGAALASDLRRHRLGEPILAHPPSRMYQVRKWIARHRTGVAATCLVVLAILAATVISFLRIRDERDVARAAQDRERTHREAAQEAVKEKQKALGRAEHARQEAEKARLRADAAREQAETAAKRNRAILLASRARDAFEQHRIADAMVYTAAVDELGALPMHRALRFGVGLLPVELARTCRASHGDVVTLAGSRDGRYALVRHLKNVNDVRVIDARTGRLMSRLAGHETRVVAGAFSGNGQVAITVCKSRILRAFDVATGAPRCQLEVVGEVSRVDGSDDGTLALTGTKSGAVRQWDLGGKKLVRTLIEKHSRLKMAVTGLRFLPGEKGVMAGRGSRVYWWDLTGKQLHSVDTVMSSLAFALSPDGRHVVAGGIAGRLSYIHVASGRSVASLALPETRIEITQVGFSPDGRLVWGHSPATRSISLWNPALSGHRVGLLTTYGTRQHVSRTHDGLQSATLRDGRLEIRQWRCRKHGLERIVCSVPSRASEATFPLAVSDDGARIAVGGRTLRIRETRSGRLREFMRKPTECVAISPDGRRLLSGDRHGRVWLWDAVSGKAIRQLSVANTATGVVSVAFGPDDTIVAATWFGRVKVIDMSGRVISKFRFADKYGRYRPACSPRARWLATTNGGSETYLWDVRSGRRVNRWKDTSKVVDLAVSESGRLLIAYAKGSVHVWDVKRGVRLANLNHVRVSSATFAHGGSTVITGNRDGWIRCWDTETGRTTLRFPLHLVNVARLRASSDGSVLVSCGGNPKTRTVKLWGWDAASSLAEAERRAGLRLEELTLSPLDPASFEALKRRFPSAGPAGWPSR